MKFFYILFGVLALLPFTSCSSSINTNSITRESLESNEIIDPVMVRNENPYFFKNKDINRLSETNFKYIIKIDNYFFDSTNTDDELEIYLSVNHLKELDNGNVYELKFKKPLDVEIEEDRFNIGILYVNKTSIFRLTDISYEKIKNLKYESEILDNNNNDVITVCQEEKIEDNKNLIGLHNFIDSDGNIRIFRSYNNLVETGYYERLVWEKDLGLVGFLSGFGAESKSINIVVHEMYEKYTSSTITW